MRRMHFLMAPMLLLALAAFGQTSSSTTSTTRTNPDKQTTTTTTTTRTQNGTTHSVEGCLVKEANDFFLVPSSGNPITLQGSAGQDLSAQEGHLVRIHGTEIAGSNATSEPAQSGDTGRDLHRLSKQHMNVSSITPVAKTCPVNWNPSVSPRH